MIPAPIPTFPVVRAAEPAPERISCSASAVTPILPFALIVVLEASVLPFVLSGVPISANTFCFATIAATEPFTAAEPVLPSIPITRSTSLSSLFAETITSPAEITVVPFPIPA